MSIPRNTPKQPVVDVRIPMLQWANGITMGRLSGIPRFSGFVGWHIEKGQDAALDDALSSFPTVDIRHPRKGSDPEVKPHWSLGESILWYPLSAGFPGDTIFSSMRMPDECSDAGIGLRWEADTRRSKLVLYGYIKIGDAYFLMSIPSKSLITEEFFAAYADHLRVLEVIDDLIDRSKHPGQVSFYEVGLPFVAGSEKSYGKGETTTVTPIQSGHPEAVDRAYLKQRWAMIPSEQIDNDWPLVQSLAREFTFKAPGSDQEIAD